MVFSSASDYFDPNWHQQTNQVQQPSGIFSADQAIQIQACPLAQASGEGGSGPGSIRPGSMLDRARIARVPLPEPGLKCPRCDSSNTKFCYFNNYNLTQPRHFCKACRRYWTRGGALRNVPVGGGCRRNKRTKRTKSAPAEPAQRSNNDNVSSSVAPNINGNGNGNGFSSQMFLSSPPQLQYLSSLHHLNGYPSGFGLNLGGGGGPVAYESGAGSSNGVSRAQQLSNLLSGSGLTSNGLYPFRHENTTTATAATTLELNHGLGFGSQAARVKAEDNNNNNNNNNGLNLSKNANVMTGIQANGNGDGVGDDDHYTNWGSGNAWTDISGFNALGPSRYGDQA